MRHGPSTPLNLLLLGFTLHVAGCDEEPSFDDQPGIEVCEMIVDECGDICVVGTEQNPFGCSIETNTDFFECGAAVTDRENLQEIEDRGSAIGAARGVLVGYEDSCEFALTGLPVFCYGCK
ncbi:MAG: hypothetical protein ACE37F_14205 [Nannocystaceae bacterium]|nr:hypothetical protein [bacterium]